MDIVQITEIQRFFQGRKTDWDLASYKSVDKLLEEQNLERTAGGLSLFVGKINHERIFSGKDLEILYVSQPEDDIDRSPLKISFLNHTLVASGKNEKISLRLIADYFLQQNKDFYFFNYTQSQKSYDPKHYSDNNLLPFAVYWPLKEKFEYTKK